MLSRKFPKVLGLIFSIFMAVIFFMPVYIMLPGSAEDGENIITEHNADLFLVLQKKSLLSPEILPAEDGSYQKEQHRLLQHLNEVATECDKLILPGKSNQEVSRKTEDLRGNSYLCIGGKIGLKKRDCLVYSFGAKHNWVQFPQLVEKHLGCEVYAFDPDVGYIDHYYSENIRFFNALLSDIDQQAQLRVPGKKGWKYRKFLTIVKELHFVDEPIDHLRLDISLPLWEGLSTMLSDGSLLAFVKQLSLEFNMNAMNATEIRAMFTMTQWLNKQGFLLAHSQPTKLSGNSYSLTYINFRMKAHGDKWNVMAKTCR